MKPKELVGKVTKDETQEIKQLFERKNGLSELFNSLLSLNKDELETHPLYEKLINDMGQVSTKFKQWWNDKSLQYAWKSEEGCSWEIDFDNGDIYIVGN